LTLTQILSTCRTERQGSEFYLRSQPATDKERA
jgi:hypothetical protein